MTFLQTLQAAVYLALAFGLFALGKIAFDTLNPRFSVRQELLERDNFAFAVTLVGYYFGLVMAIGGAIVGPSSGFFSDILAIVFYGAMAIVLLNLSKIITDKVILYQFDNVKEIIDDRNVGAAAVEAGAYVATGLVVYGAVSGEGGGVLTALVFWLLGQGVLVAAGFVYNRITPYDLHAEIEKDNVAVGVAFGGVLIAFGNVVRIAAAGHFESWGANLGEFVWVSIVGLIFLPLVRFGTDKLLLPGCTFADEMVHQEKPNVGVGLLEAFSYVAASLFIGWVV